MAHQTSTNSRKTTTFWGNVKETVFLLLIVFLIRTFGFGLYQVPTGSMETTMLVGERFFADKFTPLFSDLNRGDIISFNDPTFPYSDNGIIRIYQEYVGWPIWPWGPVNWTKRIIGIPGDHVKGVIEDGKPVIYLNDKKLEESYLNDNPLLALFDVDPNICYPTKIDWRSYVRTKSFLDQPYYRINENFIIQASQMNPAWIKASNIQVSSEGMLLKEPFTPIEEDDRRMIKRGTSYWTHTDEYDVYLGENEYWCLGDNRRGSHDCRFFGPIKRRLIQGRILYRIWSIDSTESWWIVDLIKHPIDFWSRMRWKRFFQRVT